MRKYTFIEAVELMEQGFKVKMSGWSYPPGSYVVLDNMSNFNGVKMFYVFDSSYPTPRYRDWETDRKSTRLNSSHSAKSRMPSSA